MKWANLSAPLEINVSKPNDMGITLLHVLKNIFAIYSSLNRSQYSINFYTQKYKTTYNTTSAKALLNKTYFNKYYPSIMRLSILNLD